MNAHTARPTQLSQVILQSTVFADLVVDSTSTSTRPEVDFLEWRYGLLQTRPNFLMILATQLCSAA